MMTLDIYQDKESKTNRFCIKGVPYDEKERLKALVKGVRWEPDFKFWSCPVAIWFLNDLRWAYPEIVLGKFAKEWVDAVERRTQYLLHVKQSEDIPQWRDKWFWAFPHQRVDAFFHLQVARSFDWSEPGTGKTLKFIINGIESGSLDKGGRAIVVAPNTAKLNWRNELRFAQERIGVNHPITVYTKATSELRKMALVEQWLEFGGWFVLNWEALRLLVETNSDVRKKKDTKGILLDRLGNVPINYLAVDESHKGKNGDAKQSQALDLLAKHSLRLLEGTGTPITVKPDDLYAGCHRAYPEKFTSYWWFADRYCNVEEEEIWTKDREGNPIQRLVKKIGEGFNSANVDEWLTLASGISVRRRFEEVVKDVPEKQYKILPVELTVEQERLYKKAAEDMLKQVGDELVPIPNAISLITHLRQICLDPSIIGTPIKQIPAKTEALLDIVADMNGQSLVVMSKFVKYINRLEEAFRDEGISYMRITGAESAEQRQANVEAFQSGKVQVALCGIDAAGVAITLTKAYNMVFTDRDWTKALNDQAEGRIRRIGQKHPQIFRILTAEGTVEDRIERSVEVKTAFEDAYVNGVGRITKDRLRQLLLGGGE